MHKKAGRRGWTDYADILRVVMDHPGTTSEIAARFGMTTRSMREVLYVMRDAGLIFERAWRKCTTGERLQAVWSTQGPPAPRPAGMRPAVAATPMPQLARFCRVVTALMAGAWSPTEAAIESGAHIEKLRTLLHHLCAKRLAYIDQWRPHIAHSGGGWPVPIYRWGPGRPSARSPLPQPQADAWGKWHQIRRQRLFWVHMIFLTAGAKPA